MKNFKKIALPVSLGILGLMILNSCSIAIPKGATAISNFNVDKYLGKWYEVARFDHSFERNLDNVTATYALNADGSIRVENKGYDVVKKKWKAATGTAKLVSDKSTARLKVSFFKPFWSGYHVVDIDENYQHALVVGNNLKYIWILSRSKQIPKNIKTQFLAKAKEIGYDTNRLIWVKHNP